MRRDSAAFAAALGLTAAACHSWGHPALAGGAAAVWLVSRAIPGGRDRVGRAILAAAILLAAAAASPWGGAVAVCLLAGMTLAEALLADDFFAGLSRLLATAACLVALLFQFVPDATATGRFDPSAPAFALFAAAALAEVAAMRRKVRRRAADPLMAAFLGVAVFAFAMTTAALANKFAYPVAVALSAGGFAAAIAAAALLVAPFAPKRAAESLASQAFAMETPIEDWLQKLSEIARDESDPREFLNEAMRAFASLPGVRGVAWKTDDGVDDSATEMREGATGGVGGEKVLGTVRKSAAFITVPPLTARAQARGFASPWTWFNHYLLLRAVAEHYAAKEREERRRAEHLAAAAHEAGARVAHDIKNILHALAALADGVQRGDARGAEMAKRQLPELRRRLEMALDRLRAPGDEPPQPPVSAGEWWATARDRFAHRPVAMRVAGDVSGLKVPPRLFDRALDNFAENALVKRGSDGVDGVGGIYAELRAGDDGAELRVGDDGAAVPAEVAASLFLRPVQSQTGFGVALRHLSTDAERAGWRTVLEKNREGEVVFLLKPSSRRSSGGTRDSDAPASV